MQLPQGVFVCLFICLFVYLFVLFLDIITSVADHTFLFKIEWTHLYCIRPLFPTSNHLCSQLRPLGLHVHQVKCWVVCHRGLILEAVLHASSWFKGWHNVQICCNIMLVARYFHISTVPFKTFKCISTLSSLFFTFISMFTLICAILLVE